MLFPLNSYNQLKVPVGKRAALRVGLVLGRVVNLITIATSLKMKKNDNMHQHISSRPYYIVSLGEDGSFRSVTYYS
jgi:hypothetical protein